jgi:hypothetical protein
LIPARAVGERKRFTRLIVAVEAPSFCAIS